MKDWLAALLVGLAVSIPLVLIVRFAFDESGGWVAGVCGGIVGAEYARRTKLGKYSK